MFMKIQSIIYHKMVEIASYKDSIARQLIDESNRIKMQINSKKSK